jgi:GNAT superfamily N-acetyltransferase
VQKPEYILYGFFFLFKFILRKIRPQATSYYFIRARISDLIFPNENDVNSVTFKKFDNLSEELNGFIVARSEENDTVYFQSYKEELEKRFERGDIACALVNGNKISSILFLSFHKIYIEDIDYTYLTAASEAIVKDIYTLKSYRKNGLYYHLIEHVVDYLTNSGYTTITMWIMKHNKATIHAQKKIGFQTIFQKVNYCTWLGFKKTIVHTSQQTLSDL